MVLPSLAISRRTVLGSAVRGRNISTRSPSSNKWSARMACAVAAANRSDHEIARVHVLACRSLPVRQRGLAALCQEAVSIATDSDGRETTLSGREAYGLYAQGVSQLLTKHGGQPCFSADVTRLMLCRVEMISQRQFKARSPVLYTLHQHLRENGHGGRKTERHDQAA